MLHITLHFLVPLVIAISSVAYLLKIEMSKTGMAHCIRGGSASSILFAEYRQVFIYGIKVYLMMILTMAVDLDHLLADPIYDPDRCSITTHPLHSVYLFPLYVLMSYFSKTRFYGVGLLVHMVLDGIDCLD